MTALHTTFFVHEVAFPGIPFHPVRFVNDHAAAAVKGAATLLKNMALFLASPFIGLLYAVLLPFVALGMLLWVATEGMREGKAKAAGAVEPVVAPIEAAVTATPVAVTPAVEAPRAGGIAAALKLTLTLLAAPFVALAFFVLMPGAALAALAITGVRAVLHTA